MNTLLTSFRLYWPTFYYNTLAKIVKTCTALLHSKLNFLSHWGSRPNYFDFYNDDLYRVVNRNWIVCRHKRYNLVRDMNIWKCRFMTRSFSAVFSSFYLTMWMFYSARQVSLEMIWLIKGKMQWCNGHCHKETIYYTFFWQQ